MLPKILITPYLTADDCEFVTRLAADGGVTREEVLRRAVRLFAAHCVATHGTAAAADAAAFSFPMCANTSAKGGAK